MSFRDDFLAGFTTPSISALATASVVILGLSVVTWFGIGPGVLEGGRVRYFAAHPYDDYAYASVAAGTLPLADPIHRHVLLLGHSSHREGLTSGADVERRLRRALGGDIEVTAILTDSQSLEEGAGLASLLPDTVPAVVVVGVGLHSLSRGPERAAQLAVETRFALRLPDLEAELRDQGLHPRAPRGHPLLDQRTFWLPRLARVPRNVLLGGQDLIVHRYRNRRQLALDELMAAGGSAIWDWPTNQAALTTHGPDRLGVALRTADRIQARGHRVAFLDPPMSRGWWGTPVERDALALYDTLLDDLEARSGAPVWRLNDEAALKRADFADPLHLATADATDRYTAAVVRRLIPEVARVTRPK